MTAFIGSVLVILSGGLTGLCLYTEQVRSLRRIEQMQSVLEAFRTEICVRLRPLPEAAARALSFLPKMCVNSAELAERLRDETFYDIWKEMICAAGLPAEAEEHLLRLGESISRGEPAERAFGVCEPALSRSAEALRAKTDTNRRLYLAVGFSSGCMLCLLLL